jgi:vesicle coat complex subunit
LALRSLCGLKLESILEYVDRPLQKCLTDVSAYVRKTAVMGVLKIYQLSPSLVETNGYVEQLYRMLQDVDANVVINVVNVLNELKLSTGGFEVTQSNIMMLLNRIGEFTEWGLNTVLDLVARYRPTSEDEMFAIMNLLDPVLRTANSGSVLATLKCFLSLSDRMPELHAQIITRTKPPLLTLITGAHSEVQYVTLLHLHSILHQPAAKGIFDDEFRQFFVRYNEVPHVKHLKVDLLPLIANAINARDISMELTEYVTDVDSELSRRAIKALGELALHVAPVSEEMTRLLLSLMDVDSGYIRAEAALVLKDIVRMHPHLAELILPYVGKYVKRMEDNGAKASLLWMLGEFGHQVLEAPYILEQFIENYEEEPSAEVKLQLLTATMKLFFQRAPEVQHMLGKLLHHMVNENNQQDVHDRALLCYRLLQNNVQVAATVFAVGAATSGIDQDFAEKKEVVLKKKIFAEFNTLAVTFSMPSEQFIADKYQLKLDRIPLSDFDMTVPNAHSSFAPSSAPAVQEPLIPTTTTSAAAAAVGSVNLLDWDDHHSSSSAPITAPIQPTTTPSLLLQDFIPDFMPPPQFQQLWMSWPEAFQGRVCRLQRFPTAPNEVETVLRSARIFVMASGVLPNNGGWKFFVYAVEQSSNAVYLGQVLVSGADGDVNVTMKCEPGPAQAKVLPLLDTLVTVLAPVFKAVP